MCLRDNGTLKQFLIAIDRVSPKFMSWNLNPKVMLWGGGMKVITSWGWSTGDRIGVATNEAPEKCWPLPTRGQCDFWETSSHQTGSTGILALDLLPGLQSWDKCFFVDKPLQLRYFCYNTKVLIIMQFAETHRVLRKTGSGYSTWPGWGEAQVRVLREGNCWSAF